MSANEYVLWFIGMAVAIALILGLGTLRMAGLLRRRARAVEAEHEAQVVEHHHWYDRFHHHHHAA
ncbi:hypothetical protein D0Z08_13350 [Nocardioides immobilis]|uniref:Uncharacterized protein n=1 Tax=Nocardioides immobilis TaxID=2049295 RepID=A0A417Y2D8_9ACTN|nr:hypothetical protein [Nocardioides immobilis]RHW26735.1 hypothetical protein D0Z08_13350 [Nocardioides immobilis]